MRIEKFIPKASRVITFSESGDFGTGGFEWSNGGTNTSQVNNVSPARIFYDGKITMLSLYTAYGLNTGTTLTLEICKASNGLSVTVIGAVTLGGEDGNGTRHLVNLDIEVSVGDLISVRSAGLIGGTVASTGTLELLIE